MMPEARASSVEYSERGEAVATCGKRCAVPRVLPVSAVFSRDRKGCAVLHICVQRALPEPWCVEIVCVATPRGGES